MINFGTAGFTGVGYNIIKEAKGTKAVKGSNNPFVNVALAGGVGIGASDFVQKQITSILKTYRTTVTIIVVLIVLYFVVKTKGVVNEIQESVF